MDKIQLLEKIKKRNFSHEDLEKWVQCLPISPDRRKPKFNKVGDVYMHPIFQHPYILLEKKKGFWICGLITSDNTCPEILEACDSRFFEGFITKSLFTASEMLGSFINNYDNTKHLKKVLIDLKQILI